MKLYIQIKLTPDTAPLLNKLTAALGVNESEAINRLLTVYPTIPLDTLKQIAPPRAGDWSFNRGMLNKYARALRYKYPQEATTLMIAREVDISLDSARQAGRVVVSNHPHVSGQAVADVLGHPDLGPELEKHRADSLEVNAHNEKLKAQTEASEKARIEYWRKCIHLREADKRTKRELRKEQRDTLYQARNFRKLFGREMTDEEAADYDRRLKEIFNDINDIEDRINSYPRRGETQEERDALNREARLKSLEADYGPDQSKWPEWTKKFLESLEVNRHLE